MPSNQDRGDHWSGSGVAFTSLRNGFYATMVRQLLGAAVETGELAVPEHAAEMLATLLGRPPECPRDGVGQGSGVSPPPVSS